jgi:transcriptional regulator with XRE-family HTH domain
MENSQKITGRCEHCGGALKVRILSKFQHKAIGLAGVVLLDAVEQFYCSECGRPDSIRFPDLSGLIAAVALARAKMAPKFGPEDIRFVRKAIGWNVKELARKLEVRSETVSRWENGHEIIGSTSEKLLRTFAAIELNDKAPASALNFRQLVDLEILPARPPDSAPRLHFRFTPMHVRSRARTWQLVEPHTQRSQRPRNRTKMSA